MFLSITFDNFYVGVVCLSDELCQHSNLWMTSSDVLQHMSLVENEAFDDKIVYSNST